MGWRNETPTTDHIARQFKNRGSNLRQICEELAQKNEALFQFVLQNFREDPLSQEIAFKNYGLQNAKKYWFFRKIQWSKELIQKNQALLDYIFQDIKTELTKCDTASRSPNVNIEKMKNHWDPVKNKLLIVNGLGFEKEIRVFVKKEVRTKKLIHE